jgi:hypothetical protein
VLHETIRLHRWNKPWSCALVITYMSAQQHGCYAITNGAVKTMQIWHSQ